MRHKVRAVGKILNPDNRDRTEAVGKDEEIVCDAGGSGAMKRDNLDSQGKGLTDDCAAKGYIVKREVAQQARRNPNSGRTSRAFKPLWG